MPLNSITERIWYTSDNSQNMRTLVGAYTENPIAWVISKVETANELGVQMLTLYQDFFDQHKDFIEKDSDGKIIGMWADYYSGEQTQTKPVEQYCSKIQIAKIIASTSTVKIGGSYKTLTVKIYDADGTEITEKYSSIPIEWSCSVDGKNLDESIVAWRNGNSFNQKKMKFLNNRSYLAKVLNVKCVLKNKNIKPIEAIASFDLTI